MLIKKEKYGMIRKIISCWHATCTEEKRFGSLLHTANLKIVLSQEDRGILPV